MDLVGGWSETWETTVVFVVVVFEMMTFERSRSVVDYWYCDIHCLSVRLDLVPVAVEWLFDPNS